MSRSNSRPSSSQMFACALLTVVLLAAAGCSERKPNAGGAAEAAPTPPARAAVTSPHSSIHEIEATDIDGQSVALDTYAGKVVLVVNVASRCGYTPQYEGLEALWDRRRDDGLVVLGVPSNQFGGQEPGSDAEIKMFCKGNYDVSFPLLGKATVKGPDAHPLYRYLASATGAEPKWNFNKFLVGKDGKALAYFASSTAPDDPRLAAAVDDALRAP